MRKFCSLLALMAVLLPGSAVEAALIGSDAAVCAAGKPSIDVVVSGFKQGSGTVKVTLYDGNPQRYLARGGKLRNVVVPVRSTAPVEVCIAVPAPGLYAVALHHGINSNGEKDRADGGGYSRNPHVTIFNLKPAFTQTAIRVGSGPTRTGVVLQYVRGLSIGPVRG